MKVTLTDQQLKRLEPYAFLKENHTDWYFLKKKDWISAAYNNIELLSVTSYSYLIFC